ncbi:hypothetical protein DQ04_01041010 [Trypanosoma grayi]|uniref:hypothetical protein n=1 Tax=Trypanosoma grayi TaxID=71804 RepID=UPI0004F49E00|nr:hypothetical protein DQ04_01041010 [Trypanosoma grayi]KEG13371.1 hypothetical protein DQ04_01041010 [Trypanosoma grayi]
MDSRGAMWSDSSPRPAASEESCCAKTALPAEDAESCSGGDDIDAQGVSNGGEVSAGTVCFCPIFVPSKGRHHSKRGTIALLIQDQIPFTIVVEQGEAAEYEQLVDRLVERLWNGGKTSCQKQQQHVLSGAERDTVANCVLATPLSSPPCQTAADVRQLVKVVSLPLSDQGISYVRNYILRELVPAAFADAATTASSPSLPLSPGGEKWYWVMDDDIQRFHIAQDNKNHAISPRQLFTEVYARIHQLHANVCDMRNIAIFSLEYARYAYTYGDKDMALNSYNNIASLYRYDLIPPNCAYRFRIREDYDFTLQLILYGLKTARFRNLSFDVPGMAEASGGMTEYYKTQKEDIRKQNKLFVEAWPAVAQECIKGKGALEREDIRVRWDLLHPKKSADPSATLQSRTPLLTKRKKPQPRTIAGLQTQETSGSSEATVLKGYQVGAKRPRKPNTVKKQADEEEEEQKQQPESTPAQVLCEGRRRRELDAKSRIPPGWKGYALESWRDLSVAEAELLHLRLIPAEKLRVGQTVAIVPPLFSQKPSVVEAVLIEKSVTRRRRKSVEEKEKGDEVEVVTEWSAVARGMPLLTVTHCYEVPAVGLGVAAAAVDEFFENEREKLPKQSE